MMEIAKLKQSIFMAAEWLTGVAQVKDNQPCGPYVEKMKYNLWNGAIKGEYSHAKGQWDAFCPMWHTGQAVKSLVMAADMLKCSSLLKDAKYAAEFLIQNRIIEGEDLGLLLAFEDHVDKVNTSAVLEAIDGLFYLSETTGEEVYCNAALDALRWVSKKAYRYGTGIFDDVYDPQEKRFLYNVLASQGRPLLDDAVFVKGWKLTGEKNFRQIALETAEKLLKEESPSGNWIKYGPCNHKIGQIHPRHTYWWGLPMLEVYKMTGDDRFLECFKRSVCWYKKALRTDGGFIRGTYIDFNSESFGHATSGTACAVISFLNYYRETEDSEIIEYIELGLKYCMQMQFTEPQDLNLKGAILEKILPPDGTDGSPYYLRDLGTIFFIQAACLYLDVIKKSDNDELVGTEISVNDSPA